MKSTIPRETERQTNEPRIKTTKRRKEKNNKGSNKNDGSAKKGDEQTEREKKQRKEADWRKNHVRERAQSCDGNGGQCWIGEASDLSVWGL